MTDHRERPTAPYRDSMPSRPALLIIDMINELACTTDTLDRSALRAAEQIASLRAEADRLGYPVIYVNDNFGEWHSEKSRLVDRALGGRGARIAERIAPRDNDYFIIKPQFSGFYATSLSVLLPKLGVRQLILTGMETDICVLFTAADAHMRDYKLWVPEDSVGSRDAERHRRALELMREAMQATTDPSSSMSIARWSDERGLASAGATGSTPRGSR